MHKARIGRAAAGVARVARRSCPACRHRPGAAVVYEVFIDTADNPRPAATCSACDRRVELVIDAGDDEGA